MYQTLNCANKVNRPAFAFIYILHKKVFKDINILNFWCKISLTFGVVYTCYTCPYSMYNLHKKVKYFYILNFFGVVYICPAQNV